MKDAIQSTTGDNHTEHLCTEIINAIADVKDVDPVELPPLYDVIDPDALERLFQPQLSDGSPRAGRVTFHMAGCEVVVTSAHRVTVTAVESTDEWGDR